MRILTAAVFTSIIAASVPLAPTHALVVVGPQQKGRVAAKITGLANGRVVVKGPNGFRRILQRSTRFAAPAGKYRAIPKTVTAGGVTYEPTTGTIRFRVQRKALVRFSVGYQVRKPSAPVSPTPAGTLGELVQEMNVARSSGHSCGAQFYPAAAPLAYNDQLALAAQRHTDDMEQHNYFEHESLNGDTFDIRIERAGYTGQPVAENLAQNQTSPAEVVHDWLASPSHCTALMDPAADQVGLGLSSREEPGYSAPLTWWAAEFGYSRPA